MDSASANATAMSKHTPLFSIYVASFFALLYYVFAKGESRGRLCFQERENDLDMASTDATKYIVYVYKYEVNSCGKYKLFYFIIKDKNTTHLFLTRRYTEDYTNHKLKCEMENKVYTCTHTDLHVYA